MMADKVATTLVKDAISYLTSKDTSGLEKIS